MKKKLKLACVAACAIMGASFFGEMSVQARDFTIVGWGGDNQAAQNKNLFKPFSEKYGVPYMQDSWAGGYGILQSKAQAGISDWDLVQVEVEELILGCQDGLYEKLDWSKLSNPDDFLDGAATECGFGVIVTNVAMSYDESRYPDDPPKNWADFWDLKKYPGKRALRKGPKYNLEIALMADGVPIDEVYDVLSTPEGVDRAFNKLDEIKSEVIWWEAGLQPFVLLISGDIAMGSVYNSFINTINRQEGAHLALMWAESIYAIDSWVIMKGSPYVEEATNLIALMQELTPQMSIANAGIEHGPVLKSAIAALPPERAAQLPSAPENIAVSLALDGDFWTDNLESINARYNAWLAQ